MEKLFLALIIILMLLAVPYFYKLYGLKQISKSDIPEKGDWVELSRGNIYFEWFLPDDSKEIKGTMVLVHGFPLRVLFGVVLLTILPLQVTRS